MMCITEGCGRRVSFVTPWSPETSRTRCHAHRAHDRRAVGRRTYEKESEATNWRGDEIGYCAAHSRVRARYGKASSHPCAGCGGAAEQWAYDHCDAQEKLDEQRGAFSVNPDHYFPMCRPCHQEFDKREPFARRAAL